MESSAAPAGYEFGPAENDVIGQAAKWIGIWSWISIVSGIGMGVAGLFTLDVGSLVMGVAYVVVGVFFRGAAASMRSVVETAGNDISHLMTAVEKLSAAFKVMSVIVIVAVILVVVLGVVLGTTAALAH